jgi:hypothetical protein
MKKMARVMVGSLVLGALLGGCVSEPMSFRKCNMAGATVLGEAEGHATGIMLFNFIPINQNHRFKDAYQDALSKLGGTCIVDPVIQERWFWAWVLNGYKFNVKGTVVKEAK